MIKPRNYSSHESILTEEMKAEKSWLSANAPTFGRTAPEGYTERAKAFNAKCRELGATTMMVVES